MRYYNKEDRENLFDNEHLDTAGRGALPQNVATNVRDLTIIHINIAPLGVQFAPKGRCISFLNLLNMPGSRANFLRIDGGWSPQLSRSVFHI